MATIGAFEILGQLGTGAGSAIMKIRRKSDHRVYALKVIKVQSADDRKFVDQIKHEFEVAQELNHANLVKVFELDITKTLFGYTSGAKLLLEFVDGQPLDLCKDLPLLRQLKIFRKVAEGLAYMHSKGFFHADIKPDNVLVTATGNVKIIDFGLAWKRGVPKNRVQGTMDYLAPEQAKEKIVNERTDIFNFGATLYRVLVGKPIPAQFLERGMSKLGRVDDLVKPLRDSLPNLPQEVDDLVRQCIRYRADERPSSMREVHNRLVVVRKRLKAETRRDPIDDQDDDE